METQLVTTCPFTRSFKYKKATNIIILLFTSHQPEDTLEHCAAFAYLLMFFLSYSGI